MDLYTVAMIIVPYYIEYAQSLILHYFPWGGIIQIFQDAYIIYGVFSDTSRGSATWFPEFMHILQGIIDSPQQTWGLYSASIPKNNPWELFESVGAVWIRGDDVQTVTAMVHDQKGLPLRFEQSIPFIFIWHEFGSNNYPRISLVKLSPIFKRFIHPKITHTW